MKLFGFKMCVLIYAYAVAAIIFVIVSIISGCCSCAEEIEILKQNDYKLQRQIILSNSNSTQKGI